MAFRLIKDYPKPIYKKTKEVKKQFDYLLVLDFECTCKYLEKIQPQEIIELPCAAISTKDWQVKQTFHEFIKPRVHPELTPFCSKLTGIIQDMVDNQPHFPEVFDKFCKWLEEHCFFSNNESAFVTCGNWDLKMMLPQQCDLDNITVPEYFKKWIDLKNTFCDATKYYPRTLRDMLIKLNLPVTEPLHLGIEDVNRMVMIIQTLRQQYNTEFKITNAHNVLSYFHTRNNMLSQ